MREKTHSRKHRAFRLSFLVALQSGWVGSPYDSWMRWRWRQMMSECQAISLYWITKRRVHGLMVQVLHESTAASNGQVIRVSKLVWRLQTELIYGWASSWRSGDNGEVSYFAWSFRSGAHATISSRDVARNTCIRILQYFTLLNTEPMKLANQLH